MSFLYVYYELLQLNFLYVCQIFKSRRSSQQEVLFKDVLKVITKSLKCTFYGAPFLGTLQGVSMQLK